MSKKLLLFSKSGMSYSSLLWICISFAVLIVLSVVVPVLSWFVFALAAAFIAFTKSMEQKLLFLMFLFPFASIFKYKPGAMSFFTILMLLLFVLTFIRFKISMNYAILLALFILLCMTGLTNSYSYVIKQICVPLYVYFVLQNVDMSKSKYMFAKFYILSVLMVSVVGFFKNAIPGLNEYIIDKELHTGAGEITSRFAGLWGDPNYYSVNLLLAFSLVVILHAKKLMDPVLCYASYILLILFGALTNSKSFLLMLVIVVLFSIWSFISNREYGTALFLIICISIVTVLSLSGTISLFRIILDRFSDDFTLADLTTGRTTLWMLYLEYFRFKASVLFFGNGFSSPLLFGVAPHNTYIDFIYNFGIFGSIIWFVTVLYPTRYFERSKNIVDYLPLITVLVMYFFLSELRYNDLAFHISLVLLFLLKDTKKNVIEAADVAVS